MSRKSDRETKARKADFPEYDGMSIDQLRNEQRSAGLRMSALSKQINDARVRKDHLKLRIRAMRDGDEGIGISDHALIRYLQRVRGVDINAVRREIREKFAKVVVDGGAADQIAAGADGTSFAIYRGEVISTIWVESEAAGPHVVMNRAGTADPRKD